MKKSTDNTNKSLETKVDTLTQLLESFIEFCTERFKDIDDRFTTVIDRLDLQGQDIHDLKRTTSSLVQLHTGHDRILSDHETRMQVLER